MLVRSNRTFNPGLTEHERSAFQMNCSKYKSKLVSISQRNQLQWNKRNALYKIHTLGRKNTYVAPRKISNIKVIISKSCFA